MSWKPDRENAAEYRNISMLVHGFIMTLVALYALYYNRKAPGWIIGFIVAILICYIFTTGTASINLSRIVNSTEPSWQRKVLEIIALGIYYLAW